MKELEDRIRRDGEVKSTEILKVGSFLNHQIDVSLFNDMGAEWARLFASKHINKILTIEASGIAIAAIAAQHFGNIPVVYAKKNQSRTLDNSQYETQVYSFTKQKYYKVIVSTRYLTADDHVLLIDDFLANGNAMHGLIDLCKQAGARVEGIGVAIEKYFEPGGRKLRSEGWDLQSLACVKSMNPQTGDVIFEENPTA